MFNFRSSLLILWGVIRYVVVFFLRWFKHFVFLELNLIIIRNLKSVKIIRPHILLPKSTRGKWIIPHHISHIHLIANGNTDYIHIFLSINFLFRYMKTLLLIIYSLHLILLFINSRDLYYLFWLLEKSISQLTKLHSFKYYPKRCSLFRIKCEC